MLTNKNTKIENIINHL